MPLLAASSTPDLVARGEYLARHVTVCLDCHAERDWSRFSGPPIPGTEGHGGEQFTREMGLPGHFVSRNITPGGVGDWTDGELARAIATGVTREGRAMFPIMPYRNFRHLCERDLQALVAFVRTLRPADKAHPPSQLDFPVNLIVRTMPEARDPWPCPEPGATDRGKYLATVAGCAECHTKQDKGKAVGPLFAGGWRFPLPNGGHVTSRNLTPDKETGIGHWTREQFIALFQSRATEAGASPVAPGEMQTLMPWNMFGGMTAEDLGSIFDYLRTIPPMKNEIPGFEP
jgi:mono/diheme cytochrome c family protein